jgi:cbb3-type cytochrome oxidase maturation protein
MSEAAVSTSQHQDHLPKVNQITLDHPWKWLAEGWHDLIRAPQFSLAYGAVFTLVSALVTLGLIYQGLFFVVPPLAAGFFLVAPLLGIGLYKISESLEEGQPLEFCQAWRAWKRNEVHSAAMGVTLLLILMAWMLVANLIFALMFDRPVPTWENFIPVVFLSGDSPLFFHWNYCWRLDRGLYFHHLRSVRAPPDGPPDRPIQRHPSQYSGGAQQLAANGPVGLSDRDVRRHWHPYFLYRADDCHALGGARHLACLSGLGAAGLMDVIYGLIPGMLLVGLLMVGVLFWAAKSGQFDDLEGDAHRILMDDDLLPPQPDETPPLETESGDDPAAARNGDFNESRR